MAKLELIPTDGRKSFYGKCYVILDGTTATLYSYGVKICEYNTVSKELTKTGYFDYSMTTRRHQKAFYEAFGIDKGATA